MSKCLLNPSKNLSRKMIRNLKALPQKDISIELNVTRQAVSKNILDGGYEELLTKAIRLINLAGYEITEREEL